MAKPWYNGPWKRKRLEVLKRDGYQCRIQTPGVCIGTATHVDHIISPRQGGAWFDPSNLRAACSPCNTTRGATQGATRATTPHPKPHRNPRW